MHPPSILWAYINKNNVIIKLLVDYEILRKSYHSLQTRKIKSDLDIIKFNESKEFIFWFEPSWNLLSSIEQKVLKEFYMTGNLKSGACTRLTFAFNYSERQIHRIKREALEKLAKILLPF